MGAPRDARERQAGSHLCGLGLRQLALEGVAVGGSHVPLSLHLAQPALRCLPCLLRRLQLRSHCRQRLPCSRINLLLGRCLHTDLCLCCRQLLGSMLGGCVHRRQLSLKLLPFGGKVRLQRRIFGLRGRQALLLRCIVLRGCRL